MTSIYDFYGRVKTTTELPVPIFLDKLEDVWHAKRLEESWKADRDGLFRMAKMVYEMESELADKINDRKVKLSVEEILREDDGDVIPDVLALSFYYDDTERYTLSTNFVQYLDIENRDVKSVKVSREGKGFVVEFATNTSTVRSIAQLEKGTVMVVELRPDIVTFAGSFEWRIDRLAVQENGFMLAFNRSTEETLRKLAEEYDEAPTSLGTEPAIIHLDGARITDIASGKRLVLSFENINRRYGVVIGRDMIEIGVGKGDTWFDITIDVDEGLREKVWWLLEVGTDGIKVVLLKQHGKNKFEKLVSFSLYVKD